MPSIENHWREIAFDQYSWLKKKNQKMIAGSDFDGIFSAMLLHEFRGFELIGFYDFETIWYDSNCNKEDLRDAIWVDLDIYHPDIKSIGHHVLKLTMKDQVPGHKNSLNPNLIRNITVSRNFNRKYPYGTVHMLVSLFDVKVKKDLLNMLLLWHPNSSLANAQRYRENAKDWLFNFLKIDVMMVTFKQTLQQQFEDDLEKHIYQRIEQIGFSKGRSQIVTIHRRLGGYQCAFKDPQKSYKQIDGLISMISKITGWRHMSIPRIYKRIKGSVRSVSPRDIRQKYGRKPGYFDKFLKNEQVFSYAIYSRNKIRYTTGIYI